MVELPHEAPRNNFSAGALSGFGFLQSLGGIQNWDHSSTLQKAGTLANMAVTAAPLADVHVEQKIAKGILSTRTTNPLAPLAPEVETKALAKMESAVGLGLPWLMAAPNIIDGVATGNTQELGRADGGTTAFTAFNVVTKAVAKQTAKAAVGTGGELLTSTILKTAVKKSPALIAGEGGFDFAGPLGFLGAYMVTEIGGNIGGDLWTWAFDKDPAKRAEGKHSAVNKIYNNTPTIYNPRAAFTAGGNLTQIFGGMFTGVGQLSAESGKIGFLSEAEYSALNRTPDDEKYDTYKAAQLAIASGNDPSYEGRVLDHRAVAFIEKYEATGRVKPGPNGELSPRAKASHDAYETYKATYEQAVQDGPGLSSMNVTFHPVRYVLGQAFSQAFNWGGDKINQGGDFIKSYGHEVDLYAPAAPAVAQGQPAASTPTTDHAAPATASAMRGPFVMPAQDGGDANLNTTFDFLQPAALHAAKGLVANNTVHSDGKPGMQQVGGGRSSSVILR